MDTIGQSELWTFLSGTAECVQSECGIVRRDAGHRVHTFVDLVRKIAELQFRNREHVLLFRGQSGDYLNTKYAYSLLKPSIFRPIRAGVPNRDRLRRRFAALEDAENLLVREYTAAGLIGADRLERHRIVRWSILQHYEVCRTPLLDVTHSLRIAASFASHHAKEDAYIFVVGVPNLAGGITASAESGLQIVRLSSVCPPTALRPHMQEGYLLGEYPEMSGYAQKELYRHYEIDFGRRMVAKFRFDPSTFQTDGIFPLIPEAALYPSRDEDPLCNLAARVKESMQDPEV